MSKKKKVLFLTAIVLVLSLLSAVGSLVYLNLRPEGKLAGFLDHHGLNVKAIINSPRVLTGSKKLGQYLPNFKVSARATNSPSPVSMAAFGSVKVKGVIDSKPSAAIVNADGRTSWVNVGDEFPVKTPEGSVMVKCEEVRSGIVVLSIANSQVRKEYTVR